MSVISNALKRAQDERTRRGGRTGNAPLLVPLKQGEASSARTSLRPAIIAGAAVVAIGAAAVLGIPWLRSGGELPPAPTMTASILSAAIADSVPIALAAASPAADSSPDSSTADSATHAASVRGSVNADASAPGVRARSVRRRSAPAPIRTATVAMQQGAPETAASPRDSRVAPSSGLRIAVDAPASTHASELFAQAVALHRSGEPMRARALYEQVLSLTPDDADALNNLGILLSSAREHDRALAMLRRAASLQPTNAGIWNNIGTCLREQGRASDAIAAFRHALTIDAGHAGAKVSLAQQYLAIRSLAEARRLLDEVIARDPGVAEAHYTLGQVLEAQGEIDSAIAAYDAFLRVTPARLSSHAELVRSHIATLAASR